ncbi:M23 family metallopeptidase [Runella sp.]|uniref:M23 family metallopeptidase n=1 Tax=Runella sp. TaxID=1960881 RepID=UPI003D0F1ED7
MINRLFFVFTFLLGLDQTFNLCAQQSVEMRLNHAPDVVMISGKPTVYYELHLTNTSRDTIALLKLDVLTTADSAVLISIRKDDLKKRYSSFGIPQKIREMVLSPGSSGVVYIEFTLSNDKAAQIAHRIDFEAIHKNTFSIQGAFTDLSKKPPLVLGPPLGDGIWAAIYEPSWERGHRRVFYTVDKKARIPGRFAIDFIKLDAQGRYAAGDNDSIKNWYGYGVDVVAVADGVIASVRDDFPESPTVSEHPKYPADKATGNYISIEIAPNRFAFYEHLKPGSCRVKPGQRVRKGDVIASVGFTGQTTGPHLHFHVADANSPLGAEGIPFAFEQFTLLGAYADLENFGKAAWIPVTQSTIIKERPVPNSVINFQ